VPEANCFCCGDHRNNVLHAYQVSSLCVLLLTGYRSEEVIFMKSA
jgi:hypothetical protein